MLERKGPIDHLLGQGRDGADGQRRLKFSVDTGWHLVHFAAYGSDHSRYRSELAALIGTGPTASATEAQTTVQGTLFAIAPGQHWLVTDNGPLAVAAATALGPETGSVTDLSQSRVRLRIEGDCVPALLAKGIAIDLAPEVFRVGHYAQTGLHHTGVLLHRTAPSRYELYLLRTYAVSLWEWIADAALALGYDAARPGR